MTTAAAAMAALAQWESMANVADHRMPSTCKPHHSNVETALSLFLCMGLIISYMPQILRIILKRSSIGFSPWFLFLGATSSASSFLNFVSLQWTVISCCQWLTYGACAESLLGIVQVGLQWFLFMCVFLLFLIYYPRELRYERSIALLGDDQALLAGQRFAEDEEGYENGSSSSEGDLDSLDSHVAANYAAQEHAAVNDNSGTLTPSDFAAAATSGLTAQTDSSGGESGMMSGVDFNVNDERSSSAFSRFVPTFWPVWKAPERQQASGAMSKIAATEILPPANTLPERLPANATVAPASTAAAAEQASSDIHASLPRGNEAHVRIAAPPNMRKPRRRRIKTRTPEWGLALSLAWLVAFHFIFILLVTLLLVSSLPSSSFPSPPLSMATLSSGDDIAIQGPSSRLLVDRWAAFLGWSAMLLAAFQYLPQIVHTARIKLVGSLSIPMMCLQVPGSVIFVYSLAYRPGVNITSLLAYMCTGVLQAVLLGLCVAWRIRQRRLGIDDFGKPVSLPQDADGGAAGTSELE